MDKIRQREILVINRVLASLTVVLAFVCGYLMLSKEEIESRNKIRDNQVKIVPKLLPIDNIPLVFQPKTPLTKLILKARYNLDIGGGGLDKAELDQLLWSAQGQITNWGERAVPSYKSLYPLGLVVLVRQVEGVLPGIYRFDFETQSLSPVTSDIFNEDIQEMMPGIGNAPVLIAAIITKEMASDPLSWHEAGGIAQNLLLSAKEMGLAVYWKPGLGLTEITQTYFAQNQERMMWLMSFAIDNIESQKGKSK